MKKLFVLIALPLLLIANTAFGETDLEGFWCVEQDCIGAATPSPETGFVVQILNQTPEGLFEVINCADLSETASCYGAIDGKDIYITCWDNIIVGVEKKKGVKFNYISHIQLPGGSTAATCIGTATKLPGCSTCDPDPPCICPPTP